MKYFKNLIFALLILSFVSSCEKDLQTDINVNSKLCFNCILYSDSLIHGSLSLSHSISNNKDFQKINNAQIELMKDGQPIGSLQNTGDGIYKIDINPVEGSRYTVHIKVEGYPQLNAITRVPYKPQVEYKLLDSIKNQLNLETYYSYTSQITIRDKLGTNRYWLYRFSNHPSMGLILSGIIDVNSPLVDDFNKVIDATFHLGYYYDYYYLRINDIGKDGQALTISSTNYKKDVLFFMDTDEHYDKYLKSTIKQKMNENDLLFNEPVQIYTNIENGLGIFGSVAITSFKL